MAPRPWSTLLSRAADLLYAFPALLLAIILAAAVGGSTWTGMIAIGVATIPVFARISRVTSRQVLGQDYVVAARSSGIGAWRIAVTHVLPNIAPLIGVQASVSYAVAILGAEDNPMGKAAAYGRLYGELTRDAAMRTLRFWRMRRTAQAA